MFTVTSAQLYGWIAGFVWPFSRILALLATEPVFGARSVPARVKIGAALFITLLVAPTLAQPAIEPASASGLFVLAKEILIGATMGFVMRLAFSAVEMAGDLAGLQMGLGFANFIDPTSGQTPVVGGLLRLAAMLLFLALDGHHLLLGALAESFRALPIGPAPLAPAGARALLDWGGQIFVAGVALALPIIAALLATNLALGIMTRAAPQLNIFGVGFPLTLGVGLAVLYISVPYLVPALQRLFDTTLGAILGTLRLFAASG